MSKGILIIGYIGDTTTQYLLGLSRRMRIQVAFMHLRDYYSNGYVRCLTSNASRRIVACASGVTYRLCEFSGIYQRLILPTTARAGDGRSRKLISRFTGLSAALESTHVRIVNRPGAGWENMSKLLQSYLLMQKGFNVPLSLTTSIIADYQTFRQYGETIYKSNSGLRSIVNNVDNVERHRLQFLERCPVLFQRRIIGKDVRIHVVGDSLFPVEIESDAVDYRYYRTSGSYCRMQRCESVPARIAELCRLYAKERGVVLAGFDFKVDEAGDWYCLEMNSSPGFEFYDRLLEGEIGKSVLQFLLGQSLQ